MSFAVWFVNQAVVSADLMYPGIRGFAAYFPGCSLQSFRAANYPFHASNVFRMGFWITCAGGLSYTGFCVNLKTASSTP